MKIDRLASAGDAIHVIDKTIKRTKEFDDDNAKEADNRRIKSLKNMKNVYDQQKLAIKNALKADPSAVSKNKIIFSDDETNSNGNLERKTKIKPKLFNDDEEEIDNFDEKFAVRKEYEGVSGAKLQKLNLRYKSDARFEMDANFLPENEDGGDEPMNRITNATENDNDEREWQYGILESVIGHKLHSNPNDAAVKDKNRLPQTMQRYDPTKLEHEKFLKKNKQKQKDIVNDIDDELPITTDTTGIEVSKEQFYKINDNFSSSLWSKSTGFSLLSMFGHDNEKSVDTPNTNTDGKVKQLTKTNTKFMNDMTNPFEYDSSDDEQFLSKPVTSSAIPTKQQQTKNGQKKLDTKFNHKKAKISSEKFFFTVDDERLKGLSR